MWNHLSTSCPARADKHGLRDKIPLQMRGDGEWGGTKGEGGGEAGWGS